MLQFPKSISIKNYDKIFRKIDILASACLYLPLEELNKTKFYRLQTLKSSLFSAKIEGNTLTLVEAKEIGQLDLSKTKDKSKLELSNLLNAHQWLGNNKPEKFSVELLLKLHSLVMRDLVPNAGKFRYESSAIYDSYGNVVYLTPSPPEMKEMLNILLEKVNFNFVNNWQEELLNSIFVHYYFEKTHPFFDGNGRVGRLLLKYQLSKISLLSYVILPIEEYFEKNKTEYYYFLDKNTRKHAEFAEFFLEGIIWALEKFLGDFKAEISLTETNVGKHSSLSLMPRREEILNIVRDHPLISLDGIARRFTTIPRRTLAYDVNQLIKKNLIIKHGETRGACYSAS